MKLSGATIDALCERISLRGAGVVASMTEVVKTAVTQFAVETYQQCVPALMVRKLTYNGSRQLK